MNAIFPACGGFVIIRRPEVLEFLLYMLFVLLIGAVNLWVSFGLALCVALRARGTRIGAGAQRMARENT